MAGLTAADLLALAPEPPRRNARDTRIGKPIASRYTKYQSINDMTFDLRLKRDIKIKIERDDMTLINGIPNEAVSRGELQLDGYTTLEQLAIQEALDPEGPELLEYQPVHAPSDYWDLRTMN